MRNAPIHLPLVILGATIAMSLASCSEESSPAVSDPSEVWNKPDNGIAWNREVAYGTMVDSRDGQPYRTVAIGSQTWMAENLNFQVDSSLWYDESADSGAKYGRLYSWAGAMGLPDSCNKSSCSRLVQAPARGICPSGWHVPSDSEWSTLVKAVGGDLEAGKKLKSTSGWFQRAGTDVFGFRGIAAGIEYQGGFINAGKTTGFLSSSETGRVTIATRTLSWLNADFFRDNGTKEFRISVRCLRD